MDRWSGPHANRAIGSAHDQDERLGASSSRSSSPWAARPLYERALAIQIKVLGPQHPDTPETLNNLAFLLQDQGDFDAAMSLLDRALVSWADTLGHEHPSTNFARSSKARVLLETGHATEALALGKTSLGAHEKVLGRDHGWTKDSARVTADALDALGRAEEAKGLREKYGVTEPEKPKSS